MNRGILFAGLCTFVVSTLLGSCRATPEPAQLRTLDSLNTKLEAARLTIAELDRDHYSKAAARFIELEPMFTERFNDTLDPAEAERLVPYYLAIRSAQEKGETLEQVNKGIIASQERLSALKKDLVNGAIEPTEGRSLIERERDLALRMDSNVRVVLADHSVIRKALDTIAFLEPSSPTPPDIP